MLKKSQSFLALFILFFSIFIYGLYLYDSWKEIRTKESFYEKESEIVESLKELKEGGCKTINYNIKVSVFSYLDKGIIEVGPLRYSIKGLTLHQKSEFWKNEIISYKKTNQTYIFAYIKNNEEVYVQIIFPYKFRPKSEKGFIRAICLENRDIKIY